LCFDSHSTDRSFDLEREFASQVRKRHPEVMIKNSYPLFRLLRMIKAPEEIEAVRQAMQITAAGIRQVMQHARPGRMEYELEAEFNRELARHGQRRTAFPSIISSGERNFYLHYSTLNGRIAAGELVLIDVGAVSDDYCTDVARVVPANGKFSPRQAQIYQVALEANRAVMAQARPGMSFRQLNPTCRDVVFEGLKALGLIADRADIGRYVWHGAVHHVGLDTHDIGSYDELIAENMIFTVDAGIYVREWGIGLRVEDDVLVTASGCENLSASIPATIEEIEAILADLPTP
jgi:Xaa-Pro aminopeptidase